MITNKFWLRSMGFAGILGGLILFAGDMLYYYDPVSTDLKVNMSNASDLRIKLSGISALFATWFYLFGIGQIYFAFKTSSKIARNIVVLSFAGILTAYGIIHGAYVAIAIASKLSLQYNIDIEIASALAVEINQLIRLFIYPVFALFSFIFIKEVWKRKTLYPRWILFFFPLFLFLFQGLINMALSVSLKIIIMGGFFNIILVIFFTASTIALWNRKP